MRPLACCRSYGGVFVSCLIQHSRASLMGLQKGDRLLAVDSSDLIMATQEQAPTILNALTHRGELLVLRPKEEDWVHACRQARALEARLERLPVRYVARGRAPLVRPGTVAAQRMRPAHDICGAGCVHRGPILISTVPSRYHAACPATNCPRAPSVRFAGQRFDGWLVSLAGGDPDLWPMRKRGDYVFFCDWSPPYRSSPKPSWA